MRKKFLTKVAAIATAAVLSVAFVPALLSSTHAAEDEYSYVYAGLTWQEYWANENVYNAGDITASSEKDTHGEYDKGGFDTVTRATANHGFYRSSFQCIASINTAEGKKFEIASWKDAKTIVLTNGDEATFDKNNSKVIYKGTEYTFTGHEITGTKYVPVKVKTSDLAALKEKYSVVENGEAVFGGASNEGNVKPYSYIAEVTEDTNGLKEAVKNADGTFSFSAAKTGSGSGLKDEALKTATNVNPTVCEGKGSFGEFLRVDITGEGYGDLGAKMQAVVWTYYGNDASRKTPLATYGTKFAADNWMHSKNGVQLGITDSVRCQLPEGTDGTGYWTVTIRALGYEDYTYDFEATEYNIVKVKAKVSDTSKLEAAILKAKGLNEADYTADSWATLKTELEEAEEQLAVAEYQADVDEATEHLEAAIADLVKVNADTPSTEPEGTDDAQKSDSGVDTADANSMLLYTIAALFAMSAATLTIRKRKSADAK